MCDQLQKGFLGVSIYVTTIFRRMAMRPSVIYTPYATYSKGKIGDIITFTHFDEGNILSDTSNNAESSDKSYDD